MMLLPKQTTDPSVIEKIENTLLHFPDEISEEINDFVINEVMIDSRYIFTTRKKGKTYAFCTHCKHECETTRLKHKSKTVCENCNSKCEVRISGYSRKYMIDEAYFVYYEKSQINKEAVIARGFKVYMDFSGDYKNVKPEYSIAARYLFEMNNPVFLKTYYSWPDNEEHYELRKTVFTLFREFGVFGTPLYINQTVSIDSIRKAVKDTPFQYSDWESHVVNMEDYVEYFALYASYPQVEYLSKLGLKEFIYRKIDKQPTYHTVDWNGKTLDKVLKIQKQDIKDVIKHANQVDPEALWIYQQGRKDGSNFTIKESLEIRRHSLDYEMEKLKEVLQKMKFRKLVNYLQKQLYEPEEIDPEQTIRQHRDLRAVFVRLLDYWNGCQRLDLELGKDITELPSDLESAHDNIYKQIEFKENQELDKKIQQRLKILSEYEFENEIFFIKPFESTVEIINEGKVLQHCVGGYAQKYANGQTDLFAIRRKDNPDKPFYTLEVIDGKVRQYYGFKNNQKTKKSKEIIEFVEEFERVVLKNDKKRGIAS